MKNWFLLSVLFSLCHAEEKTPSFSKTVIKYNDLPFVEATPHFYNVFPPTEIYSSHERAIVNHVIDSYEKAMWRESKLNHCVAFSEDRRCSSPYGIIPYFHLLNNLNTLPNTSHLHIGLTQGGAFVSAVYGNQKSLITAIGVDDFHNDPGREQICSEVCSEFLQSKGPPYPYQIMEADGFLVGKSAFPTPINVYVYDANHSVAPLEETFLYYNAVFTDIFIAVIDDWNWEPIREGTFNAFDELEYTILYENEIPSSETIGNSQYIAVIKK